jgi:hypothetical protein
MLIRIRNTAHNYYEISFVYHFGLDFVENSSVINLDLTVDLVFSTAVFILLSVVTELELSDCLMPYC